MESTGTTPSTLAVALEWHESGASVAPAHMAGDDIKSPAIKWKKNQTERASKEQIIGWFEKNGYGLGIVTGEVSSNLEMVELEKRAIDAGLLKVIETLVEKSGLGDLWNRIDSGYCEESQSGGLHWFYKISDHQVPGNTKFAVDADGLVLAESRSEGGFCVVAPSVLESTGKGWTKLRGNPSSIATITWVERNSIVALFKTLDKSPKAKTVIYEPTTTTSTGLRPGDDYDAKKTWPEILNPLGWKFIYTDGAGTSYWCRPGKDEGVSATTGYGESDNLYVFSTSTTFEAEKSYSKFAVYAHINHGGDFRAAASDLRNQGYGETLPSYDGVSLLIPKTSLLTPTIAPIQPSSDGTEVDLVQFESTWKPVPLEDYVNGSYVALVPSILRRVDGTCLFYKGLTHSIYGESESGKSWVAQMAAAECLMKDLKVVYIDFESSAAVVVAHLKILGVPNEKILQYFTYIGPEHARDANDPYWNDLLEEGRAELVVIDGLTEALTMWGGETNNNDGVTRWMRMFPRTVARESGAAVILIDHVTKNADNVGRFAIGAQAKLSALDGAGYLLEPIDGIAPGKIGHLSLKVTKDRPGTVRQFAGSYSKENRTQEVSVITVDSTSALMVYVIGNPTSDAERLEKRESVVGLEIAMYLFENPGVSKNAVIKQTGGKRELMLAQIDSMVKAKTVQDVGVGRGSHLVLTELGESKYPVRFIAAQPVGGVVDIASINFLMSGGQKA